MKKIGILIPQSKTYPTLGKDFISGFRLNDELEHQLVVEGIGLGNDTQAICNTIEKLVFQEDVAAIVAFVGDHGLSEFYCKVNLLEVPTIFVRLGAFPNLLVENNQYAFTLSYNMCGGLEKLGKWLVERDMKSIAVSGSFNDSGYGMLSTLEKAIYAEGGVFAGHYFPPNTPRQNEAKIAEAFFTEVQHDASIQLYNGIFAEENVEYIEQFEQAIEVPMFFTSFGFNKNQLQRLKSKVNDLNMIAPWLPSELRGYNTDFDQRYSHQHDKFPTTFSLLGFEAMKVLVQLVPKRKELLNGSCTHSTESGEVIVDAQLSINMNQKLWKAAYGANQWELEERHNFDGEQTTIYTAEGQNTGWHNAYLCY